MRTVECKQVEDKLLDYIYEELGEADAAAVRTHVAACAACRAEVDGFGRVRGAVKAELPLEEPSPAVSAKLLYQAQQLAPRPRGKVLQLFRTALAHPAYAMAASFVIVGGIAGWQLYTRSMHAASPASVVVSDGTASMPVAAAAPAPPPQAMPRPSAPAAKADEQAPATVDEKVAALPRSREVSPAFSMAKKAAHAMVPRKALPKTISPEGSLEPAPVLADKGASGGSLSSIGLGKDENAVLRRTLPPPAGTAPVAAAAPSPPAPVMQQAQTSTFNASAYDRRDDNGSMGNLPSTGPGQFASSSSARQKPMAKAVAQHHPSQSQSQSQQAAAKIAVAPSTAELDAALNGGCGYEPALQKLRAAGRFTPSPSEQAKMVLCDERAGKITAETVDKELARLSNENPSDMQVRAMIAGRAMHQRTVNADVPDGRDNPADAAPRKTKKAAPAAVTY